MMKKNYYDDAGFINIRNSIRMLVRFVSRKHRGVVCRSLSNHGICCGRIG